MTSRKIKWTQKA